MATKINQSVYGTVPTTQYSVIACPKTVLDLYNDGNFDPSGNCEGGFEKSISPWGIGGGMCGDWFTINAQRSANGRYARLRMDTMENYNKPISFWDASLDISPYSSKKTTRNRIAGNCFKATNQNIESNGATELGLTLIGINRVNSPYGKLEYNNTCIHPFYIGITRNETATESKLIPVGSYTIEQIESFGENWFDESFEMFAFEWGFSMYNSDSSAPNQWSGVNLAPVTTKAFKAGEMYKALALEDNNNPDTFYDNIIVSAPNVCGAYDDLGSRLGYPRTCYVDNDDIKLISNKFTNTTHANYCSDGAGRLFGVGNGNKHTFDDVSYHYEIRFFVELNGNFTEVKEGELILSGQQLYMLPYYKIDDTTYSSKWESIKAIIRHELAFIGFPFAMSESKRGFIGDNNVSVPIFDVHMITTGNYVTGAAASQLPNAQWGDIFSDTMPEYDPNYNPPKPSGGGESDGGFLNNSTYRAVKLAGSNEFYAMDVGELRNLMTFINGMYQGDTDDTQLKIDFKGSNPNDYIVGIYAYPFNIPNTVHLSNIYIGPVETNVKANVVDKDNFGFATFGSILVDGDALGFHGDFRDYEPYTQLELYLPMVGTAKLDPSYYVGHYVTVNYIYDINTGSLSAQILRDDTIDKIIESTLSVQIPVTARDMGSYQNNMYQMKMNLYNTALGGAKPVVSYAEQASEAVATGGESGGVSTGGTINLGIGVVQNLINQKQIKYSMNHTQPAISQTSIASPANGMQFYNNCVLFVKHLKMLDDFDPENYGKTVGYACLMNKQLSEVSGFTVCANADLSGIPATADEINAIQAALQSGIYL